jgi:hypothetical protein
MGTKIHHQVAPELIGQLAFAHPRPGMAVDEPWRLRLCACGWTSVRGCTGCSAEHECYVPPLGRRAIDTHLLYLIGADGRPPRALSEADLALLGGDAGVRSR